MKQSNCAHTPQDLNLPKGVTFQCNHCAGLSLKNTWSEMPMKHGEFAHEVRKQALSNIDLLLAKHADYGPKNIAQAPGGALNGLRVRMHDKLARINHLIDSGVAPTNESLADSFLDLANYALIAQLVLEGKWPND
jgi:hypothetical protein